MSAPRLGSGVWTFLGGDTLRRQVGEDYDEYRVAAGCVTRHVHDSGKVRYADGSTYTGATYIDHFAALESEGRWLRYDRRMNKKRASG